MQVLYQMDLRPQNAQQARNLALEGSQSEPATKDLTARLVDNVWQRVPELDAQIVQRSKHWKLERLTGIDKALLRLALYELSYEDTPPQVVVDEVVEIAKAYSTDESHKFINGILGSVLEERRGAVSQTKKV
jgi:N utilization substance protein B